MRLGTRILLLMLLITIGTSATLAWVVSLNFTRYETRRADEEIGRAIGSYLSRLDDRQRQGHKIVRALLEAPAARSQPQGAGEGGGAAARGSGRRGRRRSGCASSSRPPPPPAPAPPPPIRACAPSAPRRRSTPARASRWPHRARSGRFSRSSLKMPVSDTSGSHLRSI